MSPSDVVSRDELGALDHRRRLVDLVALLERDRLDALFVTSSIHVRYLTGFDGSAGSVIVTGDGATLVTDDRYGERARALAADMDGLDAVVGPPTAQRSAVGSAAGARSRVGLEADDVSWDAALRYEQEWFADAEVTATVGLVAELRLVKELAEIARIEAASAITDAALASVRHRLRAGLTEREFRIELDRAIIDRGADDLSFPTIVASGPFAARPHHSPGDRVIEVGDLVIVDVGALVDGYHSDMTRTFSVGTPSDLAAELLDVTTEAQAAGVAAVMPGATGDDVDRAARDLIAARGFGDEFVHGVGHGVGLLIHEDPFLRGSQRPLRVGQVVTVEPGVYRSGFGGVRVEDSVVVTPTGCRPLTRSPKDPVVA